MENKTKKLFKNNIVAFPLFFIFFALLAVSRRIDAVTSPGFWAEDGVYWYKEAYSAVNPIMPFFITKLGYLQVNARLGGYISQFFDIAYAPLVFNIFALFFQILPPLFFLSTRFQQIVPKLQIRILLGLAYIGLLGTEETHLNLTNSQWSLSILMFLIIIAAPTGKNILWKIFDVIALLLAGLSGPFVFIAFPIAIAYAFLINKLKIIWLRIAVLSFTFVIQLYAYFNIVPDIPRSKEELGANLLDLFRIISWNVFTSGILGPIGVIHGPHYSYNIFISVLLPIAIGFIGLAILSYVFYKAQIEMKFLLIFSFSVLAAGLISPQVSINTPQWSVMAEGGGSRYCLLPKLAWMVSLFWVLFCADKKIIRSVAGVLLIVYVLIGIPRNWVFYKYTDYHFKSQVEEFNQLKTGEQYTFIINPGKMEMILNKK